MISGGKIRRRYRAQIAVALAIILVLVAAVSVATVRWSIAEVQRDIDTRASETLNLQAQTLRGILEKYRLLAPLLARDDQIRRLAEGPATAASLAAGETIVRTVRSFSGALDVALLDAGGMTLVSARDALTRASSGIEEALRMARNGKLGRQSIVLAGGQRAYVFVSAIRDGERVYGFTAIFVGFEDIESNWALTAEPIYVEDGAGRILLSNRPTWRNGLIEDLAELKPHKFAKYSRNLPALGWQLTVLADRSPIVWAGLMPLAIVLLGGVMLAAFALWLLRRQSQAVMRERRDRAITLSLERKVRQRTADLTRANADLRSEIAERNAAEVRLRKAQADLIHSAKLATLGQMSAALSHEYNQPVAAIRTYSDNAVRFLERARTDRVKDNLERISSLTERMAELSRTLLGFARKPGTQTTSVAFSTVMRDAGTLLGPKIKTAGVKLETDDRLKSLVVLGGRVRLSQVFVNLINNAVDAISESDGEGRGPSGADARMVVAELAELRDGEADIRVRDNGPGIPDAIRETLFDPFVTTKPNGAGLGIGLAIVSAILAEFDGRIALEASGPDGTSFIVTLRTTTEPRDAGPMTETDTMTKEPSHAVAG